MTLHVSSAFESGNIQVVKQSADNVVDLNIRPDAGGEFLQWFHFKVNGGAGQQCTFRIINAGQSSYARGWEHYRVVWSSDREQWLRHECQYEDGVLQWTMNLPSDWVQFACFAPYMLDRIDKLTARCAFQPGVACRVLGKTIDGRDVTLLTLGSHPDDAAANVSAPRRQVIWSIARQHPGEPMASWWTEGWLERLCDQTDAVSRALRRQCDIHVVPNMNPDGVHRGHLRTNALGVNLNREWACPDPERSPEVWCVKNHMQATGVDLSLDVHGDEILPYNFIAGTEGVPSWNRDRQAQLAGFKHTLAALNPDFQTVHGYPPARPSAGNLSLCSNQLAERFGALAMTLEMPFKDTVDTPNPVSGWSPTRSKRLGASCVEACWLAMSDRLLTPDLVDGTTESS